MARPTRRQRIAAMLAEATWGFDELRQELELPVRVLATDLAHVEKSVRGAGGRFVVEPARCRECGFDRFRTDRHHVPSRCPECRSERLDGPRFRIE